MKQLQKLSKFLSDYTSIVVIAIAVITFFLPSLMGWVNFQLFTDPVANKFTSQSIIIGVIMFSMGLTLTTEDFKILAQRPFDICIGAIAQYLIMPFLAFAITKLLNLPDGIALGLILVGCCPGGVSSNIMSYLCGGDVAFFCWNDNCIYNPLSSDDTTDGILSGKRSQDHNSWITNVCIYHRNGYRTSSDRVCIKLRIRKK